MGLAVAVEDIEGSTLVYVASLVVVMVDKCTEMSIATDEDMEGPLKLKFIPRPLKLNMSLNS